MKKIIMIFLSFSLFSFGMSYEKFKKLTLKNAKVLQSQALSIKTTQEQNNILLRSQNPTLSLEASRFDPNPKQLDSSINYAASLTQQIRMPNYYGGLEDKASAQLQLQSAYVTDGRAGYIRALEKFYTEYVYQTKLLALLQDEYTLSKKVTNIVKQRYNSGSENKVAYLQAKTDTIALKTQMYTTRQAKKTLYYQLLAIAGLTQNVSLSKQFIYSVSSVKQHKSNINTKQQILTAKQKLLQSQVRMNDSTINNFELYGGMEDEPDQSILRVGINIPFPVFNQKSEEKQLAKLQSEQLKLDKEQLDIDLYTQEKMLKSSIQELSAQYHALRSLRTEQKSLYVLLQEGYRIAKGSIFVMMSAKNKLIQTQKTLLQTQKMINTQKIELHYLQGNYND